MVKSATYLVCLSSLTLLSSCNLLLGIDEAQVDPRLVVVAEAGSEGLSASPFTDAATQGIVLEGSDDAEPDSSVFDAGSEVEFSDAAATDASAALVSSTSDNSSNAAPTSDESSDDTGGDTSETDDTAQSETQLCDKYCEEVMELCTGELEQYRDMRQCQTVCAMFPEGELGSEQSENTIACRLRYASKSRYAAGTEHAAYCRQAGPGGDGRCGSNCEGYCTLMDAVCTPEAAGIYRFDSDASCMQACENLPVSSVPYSTSNVELSDGDHVQCRLFHVTSAAMLDAEEHCEHSVGLTLCEAN